MQILCLTDFIPSRERWIWGCDSNNTDEITFLHAFSRDRYKKWGKIFASYPHYFSLAWRAIHETRRKRYDLVVAWESDTGLPFALLRKILAVSSPPLIVLTFSIRGVSVYFRKVLHLAAQGIDYITVPTRFECEYYAKWLGFPQEKIFYCPHGIVDGFQGLSPLEREIYAYSGGRSERDYQTLFQAISSLDVLFIINARQYNCKGIPIPKNVILNDLVSPNQFRGLNWGSKFVVVPLDAVRQAAGITSVLWAMAAGKATIASDVPGLHDYLVEGDTGLFVPPRDVVKLRHAIEYLWNNPGEAGRLGENARQAYLQNFTFEHLANRVIGILSNLELG